MIQNRLEKNFKKLSAWADKNKIEAYRLYDRDIPEFPFIVDRYKNYFVIYDKSQRIDEEKNHLPKVVEALKNLFTEGIINKEGEVISNRVIQSAIEGVIEKEDKANPFTDQQLVTILATKGIIVARRTIAKYREQLQIPVAQLRRMWA